MAAAATPSPDRQWLPTEVYGVIARDLARVDLRTLSSVSRIINGVATPLLYQHITLLPSTKVKTLLSLLKTLIRRVDIAALVQRFILACARLHDQTAIFTTRLRAALPGLINLQHLTISAVFHRMTTILADATLPALRQFHCYNLTARIPTSFFDRHPDLQRITARLLDEEAEGIKSWGYAVEEICFWAGTADIVRFLSDGKPRPALRSVGFTWGVTAADMSVLRTQCPNVTQINHLPSAISFDGIHWPGIHRVGFTAHPSVLKNKREGLLAIARWAQNAFPNFHTLDFLIRQGRSSLSEEQLTIVDEAVHLVHEVEQAQLITAAYRAYIRGPDKQTFSSVPLTESHGVTGMPWELTVA